jgi:ABC-type branched-subunit amino acid transport system substrate-binding protein
MNAATIAAAAAINKDGGVGAAHQPLKVVTCSDAFDNSKGAACIATAVKDKVVAVVGGYLGACTGEYPALQTAQIPVVATWSCGQDGQEALNFPLWSGVLGSYAGAAYAAKDANKTKIGVLSASGSPYSKPVKAGADAAGIAYVGEVDVPALTTDYSSYVAQMKSLGADAVALGLGPTQAAQFMRAATQVGYKPSFIAPDGLINDTVLQSLGSVANGMLFVGPTAPATSDLPQAKQYNADIAAAKASGAIPKDTPSGETSVASWTATQAFRALVANLPTITSATVLAALEAGPTIKLGLTPDWHPTTTFPRTGPPFAYMSTWQNGQATSVGTNPVNISATFKATFGS